MGRSIHKETRYKKGFSLIEMIIVIIIIGILGVAGASLGSRQIANARTNSASNDLQVIATEIEDAIIDMGFLDEVDASHEELISQYFSTWDRKYLSAPLASDSIAFATYGTYAGCMIGTEKYPDPWGNEYRLYYLVKEDSGNYTYSIVIASAGPNSRFAADADNAYLNLAYDDDIVMIMQPRG